MVKMVTKPSDRWNTYRQVKEETKSAYRPIVRELSNSGVEIINATVGDPVMHGFTNEDVNKYLIKAVEEGWNMYAHSTPWPSRVRQAIADYEKRMRGSSYSPDDIIITTGTSNSLFILHYAMLDKGDEVIVPNPAHYFTGPTAYFSCFGAKVVPCISHEENNWTLDPDDMRSKITDKTKAIVINNPNNPTGAVYDEKTLKEVFDIAGEHNIVVVGDEIYGLTVFDGKKAPSLGAIANDVPVIVINGMSKIFMRTGWRFGYICLHDPEEKITDSTKTIKLAASAYGHSTRGVPTPMLAAATMMYNDSPLKSSIELVKELQTRRDYVMKRIDEIDEISCVKPEAALYAFPKIGLIPKV